MEPMHVHILIFYTIIGSISKLIGVEYLEKNFKPNIKTGFFTCIVGTFVLFSIYTIIVNDMDKKTACLAVLAIECQGVSKYFMVIKNYRQLPKLIDFASEIIKVNLEDGPNFRVLYKLYKSLNLIVKFVIVVYTLTAMVFFSMPAMQYIIFDQSKLEPLLPIFIPGLDGSTKQSYVLLSIFHVIGILVALIGSVVIDITFICTASLVIALAFIFTNEIEQLNKLLEDGKIQQNEIRYLIRNLVLMHKEYCGYIDFLNEIFNIVSATQIVTCSFGMVITIYNILMLKWKQGPFIWLVYFTQTFSYCIIGTMVELMTDQVYSAIQSVKYYLLPLAQQKIILIMIARAQRPIDITILGVVPMNIQTFVTIMKYVYSFTMFLMESN